MLFFILSFLFGAVLGLRFDIRILIPAMLLAWAVTLGSGMAAGHGWGAMALQLALVTVVLQLSYLFGIGLRHGIRALRVPRRQGWPGRVQSQPVRSGLG